MPKRICPFEFDLIPQHKVHISEKEAFQGDKMKPVYDKTLKMLFIGAKKVLNIEESDVIHKPTETTVCKNNYKQLFLGKQCELQPIGTIKLQPKRSCESCNLQGSDIQIRCTFCEKILCTLCVGVCTKCREEFCKGCTLVTHSFDPAILIPISDCQYTTKKFLTLSKTVSVSDRKYNDLEDELLCLGCCR